MCCMTKWLIFQNLVTFWDDAKLQHNTFDLIISNNSIATSYNPCMHAYMAITVYSCLVSTLSIFLPACVTVLWLPMHVFRSWHSVNTICCVHVQTWVSYVNISYVCILLVIHMLLVVVFDDVANLICKWI